MKTSAIQTMAVGGVVLSALFPVAAFGHGGGGMGGGMHRASPMTGGASGTSPLTPGTNSAGTALSSSGTGSAAKGAALGTGDPTVDQEDRKAARMISSICRGC